MAPAAIDRYLPPRRSCSKPAARPCGGTDRLTYRQRVGQTDTLPLHRRLQLEAASVKYASKRLLQLAVIVLQNYIYLGNGSSPTIFIYDKTNLDLISSYRLKSSAGISDMAMFAPGIQPATTSKYIRSCLLSEPIKFHIRR